MQSTSESRSDYLSKLAGVFRRVGYHRASLHHLAEATGLQRSSLYYFFPGGKAQMVKEVIEESNSIFYEVVLSVLETDESPQRRFETMIESLDKYYSSGRESCILGLLTLELPSDHFGSHIRDGFNRWIEALRTVFLEYGLSKTESEARAIESIAAIQGALVLTRGTNNAEVFATILGRLSRQIFPE